MTLDALHKRMSAKEKGAKRREYTPKNAENNAARTQTCGRCGNSAHEKSKCPAAGSICRNCGKKGHWQQVCFEKLRNEGKSTLKEVTLQDPNEAPNWMIGSIRAAEGSAWKVKLRVNGTPATFKIDSGADVSAMPPNTVPSKVTLEETAAKLYGAKRQQLEVLGKFQATIQHNNKSIQHVIYVVNGLEEPLLGRKASSELELIQLLCTVSDQTAKRYHEQYPELFQGLGEMAGEYKIKLSIKHIK
ncbi:uncharacterized protein LOC120842636 [Ixodes scapularis]|uniref:uncharacterized protein LOC120842636 n=1 Tax=Ixodes scapularis TaxID=6945 RepID=UPI001A9E8F66|nr:uncharacterized protein LOC120842636 [Ixodes scapularis]